MTEAEWLASNDPQRMFAFVEARMSDAQCEAFATACCLGHNPNLAWHVDKTFHDWARSWARSWSINSPGTMANACSASVAAWLRDIVGNPFRLMPMCGQPITHPSNGPTTGWIPFDEPCGLCRVYLTPRVVAIANSIHAAEDWAAMPVLADALEEAGCVNADLLGHLRGEPVECRQCASLKPSRMGTNVPYDCPWCNGRGSFPAGPHVRGCWALELFRFKE